MTPGGPYRKERNQHDEPHTSPRKGLQMLTICSNTYYYHTKISNLGTQRSRKQVNLTPGRGTQTKN